jgi:uncharacterized protein (TIGR02677 family)
MSQVPVSLTDELVTNDWEGEDGLSFVQLVPADMFRFTTGGNAPVYTAILQAFGDANERLITSLALDEVRDRLRGLGWADALTEEDLSGHLRSLSDWRLLDTVQDHTGHYATAEEYERRRLQYSLTRNGEAALAAIQEALATLASSGALQTAVLDAIADRLHALIDLHADPTAQDRKIFTTLQELEGHLEALRGNTKQFNGELQRLVRADRTTTKQIEVFREVKAATIAYLEEFVSRLDQRAHTIAKAVARLEDLDVTALHRRALVGANLPPLLDRDPGPAWLQVRAARWEGVRVWFWPSDGSAPRVEQLHEVARRAILALLQVLDRIAEARRRPSSAVEDFRVLARRFQAAPGEEGLHGLWSVAFGLGSSRHVSVAHPDPETIPASRSWAETPPVEVSVLLRAGGREERMARTGRVRDVGELRAQRAERARREREEVEAAWAALCTDGPVRLSDLGLLEHAAFLRLMDLVAVALRAKPVEGVRRGETPDGRVELLLREVGDGSVAVLRTPFGTLTGPDYVVEIRSFGPAVPVTRAEMTGAEQETVA